MLTYTAEDLRALDFDHPLPRPVRKTLFTFHLWRPARYRRRPAGMACPAAAGIMSSHGARKSVNRHADQLIAPRILGG